MIARGGALVWMGTTGSFSQFSPEIVSSISQLTVPGFWDIFSHLKYNYFSSYASFCYFVPNCLGQWDTGQFGGRSRDHDGELARGDKGDHASPVAHESVSVVQCR